MKKINLDRQLLSLKGDPMQDKLSDVLADILAMSNSGKPAKMIAWAVKLVNDGEIDVSDSDIEFLIKQVEESKTVINLAKAQLIEALEKLKE